MPILQNMISGAARNVESPARADRGGARTVVPASGVRHYLRPETFVALTGLVVLVGWTLDVTALKSVAPTLVAMKPNTAIAFVLSGVALWLLRKANGDAWDAWAARLISGAVVLVGALTLVEWIFSLNLGIDELVFEDDVAVGATPGRMSPNTAVCFVLVGAALLVLEIELGRRVRPAEIASLVVAAVALTVLAGYIFGAGSLRSALSSSITPMALHTSVAFLLLAAGILLARPQAGLMRIVTSRGVGGAIARRLLPAAIILPFVLGWLQVEGQRRALYGTEFGVTIMVVALVLSSAAGIWWTGHSLDRADAELRALAGRFRSLVESAPDGIVMVDTAGRIELVNRQAEEMFRYRAAELLGQRVELLMPDELRDRHAGHRAEFTADPHPRRPLCVQARRKDGSEFPVEVRLAPVGSNGDTHVMALVNDVTEVKRQEAQLRTYSERLETLTEIQRAIAAARSLEEIAAATVSRLRPLLGVARASVNLLDPETDELVVFAFDTEGEEGGAPIGARTPVSVLGDLEDLRRGEARITANISALAGASEAVDATVAAGMYSAVTLPLVAEGKLLGILNLLEAAPRADFSATIEVAREVADRLALALGQARLREQLAHHAQRLEALTEIQHAILTAKSVDEILHSAVSRLRPALGVARAALTLIDPETDEYVIVAFDSEDGGERDRRGLRGPAWLLGDPDRLRGGEINVTEDLTAIPDPPANVQALAAEGLRSAVSIPLVAAGELLGTLNLFNPTAGASFPPEKIDIAREVADELALALSQARLRERLARHAEELEERVRERTEELEAFTYSVSHDLRAPLRAIDGFSRILADDYGADLPEAGARYLRLVGENTQAMAQLIDGLLDFSRLGRRVLSRSQVDLDALAREVLADLASEMVGREVEVTVAALPTVEGDRLLLKQVFANLLGNALKFTRTRDVAQIEIGAAKKDGEQVFFVRDNGVGFDMRYAEKLFAVFQRLHRAEEFEGTGLGLAIVARIVARHGGRIWAEGTPDAGACFFFTLMPKEPR